MRAPSWNDDRLNRAMRAFAAEHWRRPTARRVLGWLCAAVLLGLFAPLLHLGAPPGPTPGAGSDPAVFVSGDRIHRGDHRASIRLVDDTGPTTGPTTVPPTTVPPTTVPPTTVPPTTVPPTTEATTTTTISSTTEPVATSTVVTTTTVAPPPAPSVPAPIVAIPNPPRPVPSPTPPPVPSPTTEPPADPEPPEDDPIETGQNEPEADEPVPALTPPAGPTPPSAVAPQPSDPSPPLVEKRGIGASEYSSFGRALPTFGNGDFDPRRVGTNTVLAAVLSLLIILPAELFNATLRVNYELVLSPLQRLRAVSTAVVEAVQGRLPGGRFAGTVLFAVVAALASSALDPRFGLGWGSLRLLVAQTLALFVSTFAVCRISLLIGRRYGVGGEIALRPGGLVLCFAVVLLSRAIGVSPGFLYGLVVGLQFHAPMSIERVGRIALVQAGFLLSLGVTSWLLLGVFHDAFAGPSPGLLPALGAEVLTSLSIGTTTGLVLSMMPLTYLRGERLFVWKRPLWFLTYSLVFLAFLSIAVNPVFGSLPTTDSLRIWLALYALFGVGSVLFWLRYRNTENRSALDRLTEALPRL